MTSTKHYDLFCARRCDTFVMGCNSDSAMSTRTATERHTGSQPSNDGRMVSSNEKENTDEEHLNPDTGRSSRRRTWLKRILGKEPAQSTLIHADHPHPPIYAKTKDREDLADETADAEFLTPTPLLPTNSTMNRVAPNRKRAKCSDDNHLLPFSVVTSTPLFISPSSEDEADHFYTCPSSPMGNSLEGVQALPTTPSKVKGPANGNQHRRPETLIERKEANWRLRQILKGPSAKDAINGFLTDPIPIRFPSRQSPTMDKTDFETYLEKALS